MANYYDAMMEDSENADYRSAFFTYKKDFLWHPGNISYLDDIFRFKKIQPKGISESSNGFPTCFSNFSWRAEFSFVNKEGDTVIPFEKFIPENLSFSEDTVYLRKYPVFFRFVDSGIYYNTYKISLTEEEVKKYQPETLTPVITKLDLVGFAVNADKYIPDRKYLVERFEPLQKQLDRLDHYTPLNQKMISPDEDKAQTELFQKLLYIDNLMQYEKDARIAKEQAAFRAEQERLNTIQYYEDIIVEKLSKIGITLELTDEITYKSKPDNKIRIYKIIPDRKTVARHGNFKSKAYLLVAENYSLSDLILSIKETAEFFNNYDKKHLWFNYYDGYHFYECDGLKLPKDW